ncbi:uncharacterized protein MEPE_04652 [Melanopsichium pennsylvanicum]|uniref:Uncharacterized protein n=1 Tax=Melanopsichium pennsylvanicum TaxID=63383 RepID=A0AAJ4XRV7_9BASI|nr:uncharacterized protein MEPE_04652 [Melanopsichium pennsylvanicum]
MKEVDFGLIRFGQIYSIETKLKQSIRIKEREDKDVRLAWVALGLESHALGSNSALRCAILDNADEGNLLKND